MGGIRACVASRMHFAATGGLHAHMPLPLGLYRPQLSRPACLPALHLRCPRLFIPSLNRAWCDPLLLPRSTSGAAVVSEACPGVWGTVVNFERIGKKEDEEGEEDDKKVGPAKCCIQMHPRSVFW